MSDDSNPMPPPKTDTIFTHAAVVTARLLVEDAEVATGSGPTPGEALAAAKSKLPPAQRVLFP